MHPDGIGGDADAFGTDRQAAAREGQRVVGVIGETQSCAGSVAIQLNGLTGPQTRIEDDRLVRARDQVTHPVFRRVPQRIAALAVPDWNATAGGESQIQGIAVRGHTEASAFQIRHEVRRIDDEAIHVEGRHRRDTAHDRPRITATRVESRRIAGHPDRKRAGSGRRDAGIGIQCIPAGSCRADRIGHVHPQDAAIGQCNCTDIHDGDRARGITRIHQAGDQHIPDRSVAHQDARNRDRVR